MAFKLRILPGLLVVVMAFCNQEVFAGVSVTSSISPTSTTMVTPITSSAAPTTRITVPKPPSTTPTTPTTPTTAAPQKVTKRIYDIDYTLAKYPWIPSYRNPMELMTIYQDFIKLMEITLPSIFQKGNFKDLIVVTFRNTSSLPAGMASNDTGKVSIHLRFNFTADPVGSLEPEVFLLSQNAKGELGNFTFERIVVKESVAGGVKLGNWEGGTCDLCCGQRYSQNRACTPPPKANCDGIITNRTMACQWECSLQCGIVRKFTFDFTLKNAWKDDYNNPQSKEYKDLYDTLSKGDESLISQVNKIFTESKKATAYKETSDNITVTKDQNSVHVSITVMFGEPPSNPDDPEAVFRFKTEKGQLGSFEINVKSIRVKEETNGYMFSSWAIEKDGCNKCCGGEVTQTRTCTSMVGSCSNAQLERKIKCKHACSTVQCSGAPGIVAGLFITCSFLLMSIWI